MPTNNISKIYVALIIQQKQKMLYKLCTQSSIPNSQ